MEEQKNARCRRTIPRLTTLLGEASRGNGAVLAERRIVRGSRRVAHRGIPTIAAPHL
jgi:hypothetical protein